jgi:hypothetical protein
MLVSNGGLEGRLIDRLEPSDHGLLELLAVQGRSAVFVQIDCHDPPLSAEPWPGSVGKEVERASLVRASFRRIF